MSLNLAVILAESAFAHPDKEAVVLHPFRLSYGQIDALSNQVASSLRQLGLKSGEKVGVMLPNVPQFVITYFGVLKAGGVVVPMNVLLIPKNDFDKLKANVPAFGEVFSALARKRGGE